MFLINGELINVITSEGCYYYERDIFGNIIGIIDESNRYVVKYKYDAFGNIIEKEVLIECIVSTYNPFVYKGYYYDEETGLAMVGQRYYSHELCRFIQSTNVSS